MINSPILTAHKIYALSPKSITGAIPLPVSHDMTHPTAWKKTTVESVAMVTSILSFELFFPFSPEMLTFLLWAGMPNKHSTEGSFCIYEVFRLFCEAQSASNDKSCMTPDLKKLFRSKKTKHKTTTPLHRLHTSLKSCLNIKSQLQSLSTLSSQLTFQST